MSIIDRPSPCVKLTPASKPLTLRKLAEVRHYLLSQDYSANDRMAAEAWIGHRGSLTGCPVIGFDDCRGCNAILNRDDTPWRKAAPIAEAPAPKANVFHPSEADREFAAAEFEALVPFDLDDDGEGELEPAEDASQERPDDDDAGPVLDVDYLLDPADDFTADWPRWTAVPIEDVAFDQFNDAGELAYPPAVLPELPHVVIPTWNYGDEDAWLAGAV